MPAEEKKTYYFFICFFDHCYWITGCTLGAVTGSLVSFNSQGIDFVLTALFITILIEQWNSTSKHYPAIMGAAVTGASLALFGKENFMIPAMLVILLMLCLHKEKEDSHG